MMLIALIIVWGILRIMAETKKYEIRETVVEDFVCSEVEVKVQKVNVVERIKLEIMRQFEDVYNVRRETIVSLLTELQDYEDPGEFLDENPHIHQFIFNRAVG